LKLYEAMMLRAMDEVVRERMALWGRREDVPFVYHVMGDDGEGCPIAPGVKQSGPHMIDFNHSNCVLITDVIGKARGLIREYYGEAATEPKSEICSPVQMDRRYLEAIPQEVLDRSYGCGSPVFVASVEPGHTVLDLGAGAGIECFIAAQMVGPKGHVLGLDMTPQMLAVADSSRRLVSANIGYDNVRFVAGYLERVPLGDGTVDRVLSNCVINLSPQKLRVFHEAWRVLRPGGKIVISDIVADREVPHELKFNPRLKGECIGGALTEEKLLRTLAKLGFVNIRVLAKNPWREEQGVQFHSLTWEAQRPERPGDRPAFAQPVYEIDTAEEADFEKGCVVCGAELTYLSQPEKQNCYKCGRLLRTRARCRNGHFVCDQCHGGDYVRFVRSFSAQCELSDPVEVFREMRRSYPFPVHGPEHHALVPVAFLTAYRNVTGAISQETVEEGLRLGSTLPGGTCAFWGGCAAALGVGIAYSLILDATPLKGAERQVCQQLVSEVLQRISALGGARCCQRESYLSLMLACEHSAEMLPHRIDCAPPPPCDQVWLNSECLGADCPYSPSRQAHPQGLKASAAAE
jgi:SAM-dependent methyltransferase